MSHHPWSPFGEAGNYNESYSSYVDRVPSKFFNMTSFPRVDVYQNDEDVIIKAEVPGVEKEDLDVYIDDTTLRFSGHSKRNEEYKEENIYRTERYYGNFSRTIPLPVEVNSDHARAEYRDGILSVTVPKKDAGKNKGKRVDIY